MGLLRRGRHRGLDRNRTDLDRSKSSQRLWRLQPRQRPQRAPIRIQAATRSRDASRHASHIRHASRDHTRRRATKP